MPFLGKVPSQIVDSDVDIDGGTIDGATIGSITAGAGTFTNLSATGTITFPDDGISGDDINGGTISNVAISGTTASFSGDLTVDTDTLYVDSTNNRVGVGTASPQGVFNVQASSSTATANALANTLVLEASTAAGMSIISNTGSGRIFFGDPGSEFAGYFIYEHGADALRVGTSSTERMRIDASGNVGIGSLGKTLTALSDGTNSGPVLAIGNTDTAVTTGDTVGSLTFLTDDNSYDATYPDGITAQISAVAESSVGNRFGLSFYTGNASGTPSRSERMRIDSSGNLLVGHTSAIGIGVLEVTSPSAGRAHEFYKEETTITAVLGNWRSNVGGTQAVVARVLCDGDFENANNSYTGFSDVRLKENIVDASPQLDDIMAMRVRSYNLKSTGAKHIGVIAQELEETSPELVKTGEDGMKSVKYSVMYMKAIKALQEAVTRIEALEAEVAALKGA